MKEGDRVIISREDDILEGTIVKFSDCPGEILVRLDCYLFGFVWYDTSKVKVIEAEE